MAKYNDPDDFMAQHQIKYGVGEGQESIDVSLQSTNRAAHEANNFLQRSEGVHDLICNILRADEFKLSADRIAAAVWAVTNEWQNQAEGDHNAETLQNQSNSTNGQVYRTAAEVAALRTEVAELTALVKKLLPAK